jgi:hypothetical protein
MARFTEVQGVLFTESTLPIQIIEDISFKAPTQNTTLVEMKGKLAERAKALGGNGLINFKYGQKADKPLRNVFSLKWDTERMIASGSVVFFESDPRK